MTRFVLLLFVSTGCFSSMVDNPCKDGFAYEGGACIARTVPPDGGVGGDGHDGDGGVGGDHDGGPGHDVDVPDAIVGPSCVLPEVQCDNGCKNLETDPDNCGTCAHVCASGLCTTGHCVGDPYGHVVAIGHDFAHHHLSMARVLGNAVSLGLTYDVAVAWWPAGTHTTVTNALASAMVTTGRPWHSVPTPAAPSTLNGVDVVIVDGAVTAAAGVSWESSLDAFLLRGGVVIVVEGVGGTGHEFAAGANLFTSGAPVDVTDQQMVISNPTDSISQQVIAPYLGEGSSVSFPGVANPVITTTGGATVVFHLVR